MVMPGYQHGEVSERGHVGVWGCRHAGSLAAGSMVRVVLLVFSAPTFLLFGVVGLAGGLTPPDIRRWSAGRPR